MYMDGCDRRNAEHKLGKKRVADAHGEALDDLAWQEMIVDLFFSILFLFFFLDFFLENICLRAQAIHVLCRQMLYKIMFHYSYVVAESFCLDAEH